MKRSFMRQPHDRNLRLRAGPRRGAFRSVSGEALSTWIVTPKLEKLGPEYQAFSTSIRPPISIWSAWQNQLQ